MHTSLSVARTGADAGVHGSPEHASNTPRPSAQPAGDPAQAQVSHCSLLTVQHASLLDSTALRCIDAFCREHNMLFMRWRPD